MQRRDRPSRPRRDRPSRPRRIEELFPEDLRDYFFYMAAEFYINIINNRGFDSETFPFPSGDDNLLFLLEKKDVIKIALKSDELIGYLKESEIIPKLDFVINLNKAIDELFINIESRLVSRDQKMAWESYTELKEAYDGGVLDEMQEIYNRYNTGGLKNRSKNFKDLHNELKEKIDELNGSLESADSGGFFYDTSSEHGEEYSELMQPEPEPTSRWERCLQCLSRGKLKNKKKTKKKKKKHTKKKKKKNTKQKKKKNTKRRR